MASDPTSPDIEERLGRVPLFSGLARKELKKLVALCLPKAFPEGARIVEEGKAGLGLFLVTAGKVEVYKGEGHGRVLLGIIEAGDILGEMTLIDDRPRSATGVALEPTECLLITRDSFQTLVEKSPEIAWCIVPVLVERLRALQRELIRAPRTAPEPAGAQAAPEHRRERPAGDSEARPRTQGETMLGLLRAEHALLRAGVEGLGGSIGVLETFLRTLANETAVKEEERLDDLLKALPKAIRHAITDAINEGERLPERVVATYRRERGRH